MFVWLRQALGIHYEGSKKMDIEGGFFGKKMEIQPEELILLSNVYVKLMFKCYGQKDTHERVMKLL